MYPNAPALSTATSPNPRRLMHGISRIVAVLPLNYARMGIMERAAGIEPAFATGFSLHLDRVSAAILEAVVNSLNLIQAGPVRTPSTISARAPSGGRGRTRTSKA